MASKKKTGKAKNSQFAETIEETTAELAQAGDESSFAEIIDTASDDDIMATGSEATENKGNIDTFDTKDLNDESFVDETSESVAEATNEVGLSAGECEEDEESFLPEVSEDDLRKAEETETLPQVESVEGSELDAYESAEIEEVDFVEEERLDSIIESILFASDRPVSLNQIKMVFKGTNIRTDKIRRALDRIAVELAGSRRGVSLEEVPGGFQLRTKIDNMNFITRTLKARPFKLSGPALEVLAIVAYKQPLVKSEIDDIRGVESGHLLRALMEKGLASFEGKSDLPGKPMQYGTTKKFLEIFGLRNLKELPTISQIDELLPDGIGDEDEKEKTKLSDITGSLSQTIGTTYSDGEEELLKITDQLTEITTTTDFFEQEKLRQKQAREAEKAQSIREAMLVGETISTRDRNWLERYDQALASGNLASFSSSEAKALGTESVNSQSAEGQGQNANDEVGDLAAESQEASLFEEEADNSIDQDMGLGFEDDEADDEDSNDHGPRGEANL